MTGSLALFHPHTRAWFESTFSGPTDVQARSWPVIAAGRHALITAPTGSGKTLTAFLWALDAFASGRYEAGATRVLYLSPLKALNNDIQRNLLEPLDALRERFDAAGDSFPPIRVQVRSGDTSSGDRQRMLRRPPEILITTPESLMLMLTNARGRVALGTVQTVILDEIHSVVDNRRGTVLTTSLERLERVAGAFQRIALSATVNPLTEIAAFVAGRDRHFKPRPIEIVEGLDHKQVSFNVSFPPHVRAALDAGQKMWEPLTKTFREIIARNHSTLFFTNSRRLAERITLKINDATPQPLAYAHHGSLSREIRTAVETRLKSGELRAIVATNSLEMGIDIGSLDEVVLIQSPPSIASALQRVGRAGHRVGDVSRGTLFPTHAQDFVEAAALADGIAARDLEPLACIDNPLDVLAQIIVSMSANQAWHVDDLYSVLRQSHSYRTLPHEHFELVVEMLAGRYAGTRLRDLKPRIVFDRIERTVHAAKGAVYALYNSGGTIPDRGYYHLRHTDTNALIGELDEEFVWEATVGQTFAFGNQGWQINRITHNDVLASPAKAGTTATPFWLSEGYDRSSHYSGRIGEFLERTDALLERNDHEGVAADLARRGFDLSATDELIGYLDRQREHTGAPLPHRRHVLVEHIKTGPGGYEGPDEEQIVLHTGWGGRVNRPYALALSAAWEREYGYTPELHIDNEAVAVQTNGAVDPARVIDLVRSNDLDALLHVALERSGFFGARFRECAGRALLVTRQRFNQRMPLWMTRMHAKKLLTTVKEYADFPVLLETYRTCLVDEFDLAALRRALFELESGEIRVTTVATQAPSPFAANIAWGQITRYMYADDSPETNTPSALSDDLIRAAVFDAALRPRVDAAVIEAFVAKRQRTAAGYAPTDVSELSEWLKERVLMGAAEWTQLSGQVPQATGVAVHWLEVPGRRWAVHPELARSVTEQLRGDVDESLPDVGDPRDRVQLLREILSFHGPLTKAAIGVLTPLASERLDAALSDLVEDDVLVVGHLVSGDEDTFYCDADNMEILLRMQRASARHRLEPRPLVELPGFIAGWQRFGRMTSDDALGDTLERLRGYAAEVDTWLNDLIEARHVGVDTRQADEAIAVNGFAWTGRARGVITVMPLDDLALLDTPDESARSGVETAFRDRTARYSFHQLVDVSERSTEAFSDSLWHAVWSGAVSADSLAVLRAGSARDYTLGAPTSPQQTGQPQPAQRHRSVARRHARSTSIGWPGHWFLLPNELRGDDDPLTELETAKDRVRILLDRYGVLSREIANREGGPFRWATLFRALRIMELSGEIVSGLFFHGLSGPQFAAPAALRSLERGAGTESFWVNATDPVAPTGLGIDWPYPLPHRRAGNYLALHRGALVLTVENYGKRLTFAPDLDDAALAPAIALLTHLLTVRRKIPVDSIDGAPPSESRYLTRLADVFDVARDHRRIELVFPAKRIG